MFSHFRFANSQVKQVSDLSLAGDILRRKRMASKTGNKLWFRRAVFLLHLITSKFGRNIRGYENDCLGIILSLQPPVTGMQRSTVEQPTMWRAPPQLWKALRSLANASPCGQLSISRTAHDIMTPVFAVLSSLTLEWSYSINEICLSIVSNVRRWVAEKSQLFGPSSVDSLSWRVHGNLWLERCPKFTPWRWKENQDIHPNA